MGFRKFLLNEQSEHFSHRLGTVLTAVHELIAGGKQIGARHLVRQSEAVVREIRKILHGTWPSSERKHLLVLQKCGVALMKCIDEKGDLREVLNSVRHEIEQLSGDAGGPLHHLGAPEKK